MKTELSQHKLKEKTLVGFSFYIPHVPPFPFAFKQIRIG